MVHLQAAHKHFREWPLKGERQQNTTISCWCCSSSYTAVRQSQIEKRNKNNESHHQQITIYNALACTRPWTRVSCLAKVLHTVIGECVCSHVVAVFFYAF